MQSIRNNAIGVLLLALWGLLLSACENKEDPKALSRDEWTAPALDTAALPAAIVLDSAGQDDALTFHWTSASLGVPVPVEYTLLIGSPTATFAKVKVDVLQAQVLGLSNVDSLQITEKTLNTAMLSLGVPAGQATKMQLAVMAVFTNLPDTLFSQPVEVTVTPWEDPDAFFNQLYIVGNFNGWNNANAKTFLGQNSDVPGTYTGYYFMKNSDTPPTGGGEFKILTVLGDWNSQWGDDGNQEGLSGSLKAKAGGPDPAAIQVPELGFYKIFVDWKAKSYQLTPLVWGIIGNATPGGWDNNTPMTLDPATQSYTITANLTAGEWKLRLGNSWDYNIGGSVDKPVLDGGNMTIDTAGNYTITLNVANAFNGVYVITLKKNPS